MGLEIADFRRDKMPSVGFRTANAPANFQARILKMSVLTDPMSRPWRTIADEITREQDSQKMLELVRELERALDEQEIGRPVRKSVLQ